MGDSATNCTSRKVPKKDSQVASAEVSWVHLRSSSQGSEVPGRVGVEFVNLEWCRYRS